MRARFAHFLILATFGVGAGHWLWRIAGPAVSRDYVVGGAVTTLRSPSPDDKRLYLRRALHLPRRARTAWIEVLGRDRLEVLVNGNSIGVQQNPGYDVAVLADIAPYLEAGENFLAISAQQYQTARPPEVAVRGGYWLEDDDAQQTFGVDGPWRCQTVFERRGSYWFTCDFDDAGWAAPERGTATLRAIVNSPPRALMTPGFGRWISPDLPTAGDISAHGQLDVPERPRRAWLRAWASAPYRLAVNGVVIDATEEQLGLTQRPPATQWVYDVSALVASGVNHVAVALTTERPPPHLLLEMEVEGHSGNVYTLGTGEDWRWRPASGAEWLIPPTPTSTGGLCDVARSDVSRMPWHAPRRDAEIEWPWPLRARWLVAEAAWMFVAGLVAWGLARLLNRWIVGPASLWPRRAVSPAYVALVPTAALLLAALIAVHDPRVADERVYRPLWFVLASVLVLVQWVVLAAHSRGLIRLPARHPPPAPSLGGRGKLSDAAPPLRPPAETPPPSRGRVGWGSLTGAARLNWVALLMAVITLCGAGLRIRGLTVQPLTPDECTGYRATLGFLERGYPSAVIGPNMPLGVVATSELVYAGTALSALVFDDERLVMRVPAVCWGILTIVLLYVAGKHLFNRWVGVTAAALYAFSPYCAETSQIGRYFSQLQGFTLLTVYVFYRTVSAPGPLPRRGVWLTAILFCCTYLSWEASGLLALGMIAAALVIRRHRLRSLFCEWSVWGGMALVGVVVLVQSAHRTLQQTLRLLYGSGATDVTMTPMWTYPGFDLWYYVRTASWSGDSLIPLAALAVALVLTTAHRFRRPARALFVIALGLGFVQALLLPVTTTRYAYHLLPMLVLLSAAGLVALAEALVRGVSRLRQPAMLAHARGVAAFLVLATLTVGSGAVVKPRELTAWRTGVNDDWNVLTNPDQVAATRYVREHLEPGDAVLVALPNQARVYLGAAVDYWLQTQMALQLTLDDRRTIPLHRLSGEETLPSLEQLHNVLARHRRVWFITSPAAPITSTNSVASSELVRRQMEVVYEDFRTLVFLFGRNHLPADLQQRSETALNEAPTVLLP